MLIELELKIIEKINTLNDTTHDFISDNSVNLKNKLIDNGMLIEALRTLDEIPKDNNVDYDLDVVNELKDSRNTTIDNIIDLLIDKETNEERISDMEQKLFIIENKLLMEINYIKLLESFKKENEETMQNVAQKKQPK